ncbi:MAG: tetratricopeptide repeat protein [Candidatus Zixiibacteriota bacterium]|nr:MAG: tetratricopeptide repeat protein [candidate division Zixibacteria bacterium]
MKLNKKSAIIYSSSVFFVVFNMIPFVPRVTAAFKYLQEGMSIPEVRGKDVITGEEVSSQNLLRGNVLIVAFWATWSERSIMQLKDMKEFYNDHPDLPLKIIAVNVENQLITPEERKIIESKIVELDLPFPVLIDDNLSVFYEFGVIAVPSTAILDSTGILRYAPSGYSLATRDLIVDSVEVLLGLKKPSITSVVKKGYQPAQKASRYYRLALQLAHQRMYERALANLEMAREADTLFSAPHNLRGQIYLEIDSIDAAVRELETAVRLDSTSVAARAGLGRALLIDGRIDDAFDKLSALHAEDDTYTPALLDLALVMVKQEKYREAIDSLKSALELNPRDPIVHYYLGKTYQQSGQKAKALESYKTALELIFPAP